MQNKQFIPNVKQFNGYLKTILNIEAYSACNSQRYNNFTDKWQTIISKL